MEHPFLLRAHSLNQAMPKLRQTDSTAIAFFKQWPGAIHHRELSEHRGNTLCNVGLEEDALSLLQTLLASYPDRDREIQKIKASLNVREKVRTLLKAGQFSKCRLTRPHPAPLSRVWLEFISPRRAGNSEIQDSQPAFDVWGK